MTLRRARTSSTPWRHTLAVAVLALLVSVVPCAAEICKTTCALAHPQAFAHAQRSITPAAQEARPHAARAASASASSHCAKHTSTARSAFASAHACQMHSHPGHASTFGTAIATAADTRLSASSPAILPIVASASIVHPPVISPRVERLSAQLSRTRPLTVSLRI